MKKTTISIGNSMIFSDIWHKYHEWYFEIVIRNLRQFWNITSGIYAHYHVQIILLFVYTTARKGFVMFTFGNFKLSWNTTGISQSNWRNFSCSIKLEIRVLQNFPKLEERIQQKEKKERKAKEEKDKKDIPQNLSHDQRRQLYYYTKETYIPQSQYSFWHIYP